MVDRAQRQAEARAIWYGKIDTIGRAEEVIRAVGKAFLGLAALQLLLAIWVGPALVVDATINAALALSLMRFRSRTVACLLLAFALLTAVVTAMNRFGGNRAGPQNVILGTMALWFAIRATVATFRYHALAGQQSVRGPSDGVA